MYCNSCGSYMSDDQPFCFKCGAPSPLEHTADHDMENGPVPIEPYDNTVVRIETPMEHRVNKLAKAGVILGALSIASNYFMALGLNLLLGIAGIIVSVIGRNKSDELGGRKFANAGIITSCIGITFSLAEIIAFIVKFVMDRT